MNAIPEDEQDKEIENNAVETDTTALNPGEESEADETADTLGGKLEAPETEETSGRESEAGIVAADSEEMTDAAEEVYVDQDMMDVHQKLAENKAERKAGIKKFFKIFGIAVAVSVLFSYIAVSVWFSFHFNYRTYINGDDFSFYSVSEVADSIEDYIDDYTLTLKLRDGEEFVIAPQQIGLVITPSDTAKSLHKRQNGFLWPYYIFVDKHYEISYEAAYDKDMLESLLGEADFTQPENMIRPKSAYVDVVDGAAAIISEKVGNYIDFQKLCDIIDEALVAGDEVIDISNTAAYLSPSETADSEKLIARRDSLEEFLDMTITFEVGEISWKLTSEEYGDWVSYGIEGWSIQEAFVSQYVASIAEKYDTYGTEREFTTHDGRVITQVGEYYGWKLDVEQETEQLLSLLDAGESCSHVPVYECEGAAYTADGDIGDTYVECDLGQQHVYVYVDGNLVLDSDCVTGSVASGHTTPEGLYAIMYKKSPAVLVGEDYETPVSFWMPFNAAYGIGLHDATWRGSFGGTIYKNSGSHGCVNLPYSAAQQLFSIVYAGMPVICYY